MNSVGVRTPKCRWGHATFLCPGTQRTKEDAGAKPTARLHSEVAESSVTLKPGHVKRLQKTKKARDLTLASNWLK